MKVSIVIGLCLVLTLASGIGNAALAQGSLVALDSGAVTIRLPRGIVVVKQKINFETDAYVVRRKSDGAALLAIVVGGGDTPLRGFHSICLNHKQGWRGNGRGSADVLVGYDAVNSVSLFYEHLTPADAAIAEAIIASAHIVSAKPC